MKTLLLLGAIALSINVFGQSSVKIGNLEVMTEDLGDMEWGEGVKACANLGDGWRLPTKDELNILYENKDEIGGFFDNAYWSSTNDEKYSETAWLQFFNDGKQVDVFYSESLTCHVRAVRAF